MIVKQANERKRSKAKILQNVIAALGNAAASAFHLALDILAICRHRITAPSCSSTTVSAKPLGPVDGGGALSAHNGRQPASLKKEVVKGQSRLERTDGNYDNCDGSR